MLCFIFSCPFFFYFFFSPPWRRGDGTEVWLIHSTALVLCCRLAPAKTEHWCRSSHRVPVADGVPERFLRGQHPLGAPAPGQPHHGLLRDVCQPDHGSGSLSQAPLPQHTVSHCEDQVWRCRSFFLLLPSSSSLLHSLRHSTNSFFKRSKMYSFVLSKDPVPSNKALRKLGIT